MQRRRALRGQGAVGGGGYICCCWSINVEMESGGDESSRWAGSCLPTKELTVYPDGDGKPLKDFGQGCVIIRFSCFIDHFG